MNNIAVENIFRSFKKSIVILGSSRVVKDSVMYAEAYKTASYVTSAGYTVITGGSNGIMEAANRGAIEVDMNKSACVSSMDDEVNEYISSGCCIRVKDLYERSALLTKFTKIFVCFAGGIQTMQEVFSILAAFQTGHSIKLILVGEGFWNGLKSWMIDHLLINKFIDEGNLSCIEIVKNSEQVLISLGIESKNKAN